MTSEEPFQKRTGRLMSRIKHPFDYLSSEDHARIERWLIHPDPTIAVAEELLGLDRELLLNFIKNSGIQLDVLGNLKTPLQSTRNNTNKIKRIILKYTDGGGVTDVADFIISQLPDLIEGAENFTLIPQSGEQPYLGSGDDTIVAIELHCNYEDTDIIEKIRILQLFARQNQKELAVIVKELGQANNE